MSKKKNRIRKNLMKFEFKDLSIGHHGLIKLSLDSSGYCEIVTRNPDVDPEIPKFYIFDSKGNDLGWIHIYDLDHSEKLNILTKEDKKAIMDFMLALDELDTEIANWYMIDLIYSANFNNFEDGRYQEYLYNKYEDLQMPDYNNL